MHVIHVRNVNHAYRAGMDYLGANHMEMPSRNGPVLRAPLPVTTVYTHPWERVLFNPLRNCNPFFHYMESMWMLGGKNDLASLIPFNKRMTEFSDDGDTLNGAYGYRWRHYFGKDQLTEAARKLLTSPIDRRVVVGMWDPSDDLFRGNTKDVPCNICLKFMMNNEGTLDMICFNRSNDIIWGAYGANAVHLSMVHEYVALKADMVVGQYYQISSDFHAYKDIYDDMDEAEPNANPCPYTNGEVDSNVRLMSSGCGDAFDEELKAITTGMAGGRYPSLASMTNDSLKDAVSMAMAWTAHKVKETSVRDDIIKDVIANDWRRACREWFARRDKGWAKP